MQTFLPQSDYSVAAAILDSKRLNKQILECYQILNVLSGKSPTGGWRNHPAVLMWKGFERGLWSYVQAMITEAKSRGIKTENNEANLNNLKDMCWNDWGNTIPDYFQDENKLLRIVTTHRANLFKKDPLLYAPFQYAVTSINNAPCCPERKEPCKYYWPTHEKVTDSALVGH
jgi:hypothetical protein